VSDATDTQPVPAQTADSGPPTSPTELGPPGLKVSLQRAVKEFKVDRGSLVAAGMAFYWFLAVFPAVIAAVGVLGLTDVTADTVNNIKDAIDTTLPGEAANTLKSTVDRATEAKGGSGLVATVLGLALALWGASAGMVALQRGLDVAYDVEEERKLVSARARAMLLIVLTIVLGGVATVLIVFGAPLGESIEDNLPFGGAQFVILWTIARWLLGLAALSILFAGYYALGPNREKPRWTWVSPGGIVATVVWLLASLGFSLYVTSVGDLGEKYGSLSGVVALLLWLYLSALAVILGAELNAELERQGEIERRERRGGRRQAKADARTAREQAEPRVATPAAGNGSTEDPSSAMAPEEPPEEPPEEWSEERSEEPQQAAGDYRSAQDAWRSYGR